MKNTILIALFVGFAMQAYASKVIPPRMVVEQLIEAVQEDKGEVVGWYFTFDKEKHGKLTPLSRDEQIKLLKDIPQDKMEFDKDKYAMDEGERFVVRLVAPKKLDFEVQRVLNKGELGPPWSYDILAIRETAQLPDGGDGKPAPQP